MNDHYYLEDVDRSESVEGFYLLADASIRLSRNDSPYLYARVTDISGSMDAVFWNYLGDMDEDCKGEVVYIRAVGSEYNGKIQLVLSEIRFPTEAETMLHVDLEEIIPGAMMTYASRMNDLEDAMNTVEDEDCRKMYEYIREKYGSLVWTMPASEGGHHSYVHGWLAHTVDMLRAAEDIARVYEHLDRDLLLTGVFMHDVGKFRLFELSKYGLVTGYTAEGLLLGRSVLAVLEIQEAAAKFKVPKEKVVLLLHMVLAHYDASERGTPITPAFPEACVLAHLNKMDIAVDRYATAMSVMDKSTFSGVIPGLDGRVFNREFMTTLKRKEDEDDEEVF